MLGNDTAQDVGGPAGCERHDDFHRTIWPALSLRAAARCACKNSTCQYCANEPHAFYYLAQETSHVPCDIPRGEAALAGAGR
jgi:hypothetical protein